MQQVGHVGGKQFCVDRLVEEGDDRFYTCTSTALAFKNIHYRKIRLYKCITIMIVDNKHIP